MSCTGSLYDRSPDWVGSVWKKYSYRIYKLCLQKCRTKDEADDLFQEVALRFCQKANALNNHGYILPWLRTVLLNCHCSDYRKKKRCVEIPLSYLCEPMASYDGDDENTYVIPDEHICMEAVMNEFSFLLQELTPLDRMIVELSVVGGLHVRDLSRLIGLSKCSIVTRRMEAYQKMREKMMAQKEQIKLITGREATLREIIELAG